MHARVLSVICILLATATALATTQAPPTTTSTPPPTSTIPPALTTTQAPPPTTNTPPPTSTIPPGYKYYAATGSYYKYHHERGVTWYVANTTCASEGAHLTVMNDAEEADIVERIVRDGGGDYYYTWTGLRDQRPGGVMDWRTVDGKPVSAVFNVWGDGRPANDAEWTCAYFRAYYKHLYDYPCHYVTYFTCEISQQ